MLNVIGSILAIIGAVITIYGTVINSIWRDHKKAIWIWDKSNFVLVIWGFGYMVGWWTDALSGAALFGMYLVLWVFNRYALHQMNKIK